MVEQVVTIEGSLTPSAELPRGERRTVLYTDRIKKLVKRGYITVVVGPTDLPVTAIGSPEKTEPESDPPQPDVPADHTGVTIDDPSGVSPLPTGGFAPQVPQHPNESAQPGPVTVTTADAQRADQFSSSAATTDQVQTDEKPTG